MPRLPAFLTGAAATGFGALAAFAHGPPGVWNHTALVVDAVVKHANEASNLVEGEDPKTLLRFSLRAGFGSSAGLTDSSIGV
jgi:hypothetical protein